MKKWQSWLHNTEYHNIKYDIPVGVWAYECFSIVYKYMCIWANGGHGLCCGDGGANDDWEWFRFYMLQFCSFDITFTRIYICQGK